MALKLTVTPSTQYIEDSINVKITGGTIPNNLEFFMEVWKYQGDIGDNIGIDAYAQENNLSNNFNFVCPNSAEQTPSGYNYGLPYVYQVNFTKNTSKLNVLFVLYQNQQEIAKVWKTMYIKPEPPTFDVTPTYEDINNDSLALTNDNQIIVNGLSDIRVSNIHGTAHKGGDIVSININGNVNTYNNTVLLNDFNDPVLSLNATLIDSRGWKSKMEILAYASKFKYSYLPPTVEASAERDDITEITKIKANGYYLEGYQRGANPLINFYKWQEIGSGNPETTGETTLTIIKEPTTEWVDFNNIIDEFENPNYLLLDNMQYYTGTEWNNGISDLFSAAIQYNNKYTEAYLQVDYDSVNDRYYCVSGGYNGNWRNFWLDTIKALYRVMYGDKRANPGDNGNNGNYEWHIEETAIKGDLPSGFSINSSYYINYYIQDNISDSVLRTLRIGTAIPAIDVYKSNVAIHGLYDENLGGTQINGDLFLNGEGIFQQNILWQGGIYMKDVHTINLSKNISDTKHGIVLVWSGYDNSATDNNFFTYYIPKEMVALHNGAGYFMSMGGTEGIFCYKYLYVRNNSITGHANNAGTHSQGGLTYNNSRAVLRYVIEI